MATPGKIILLLLLLLPAHFALADQAALDQAEKLVQSGDWEKARQVYKTELAASPSHLPAAFFYNYGTILAKAGAQTEAFVPLLRAEFLRPLDSDIRHNLALVQKNMPASALGVRPALWFSWWPTGLLFVPWEAWLCLGLLCSLLGLVFFGRRISAGAWASFAAALLFGLIAGGDFFQTMLPVSGVIQSAKVKSGPGPSFPDIITLEPGSLLNVESARDGWLKVRFVKEETEETVGWIDPTALLGIY